MAENEVFNQLAQNIPLSERRELLEKITTQSLVSSLPLYEEKDGESLSSDIEAQYAKLPWYERFFFALISMFKGISALSVFEKRQIEKLGKLIIARSPGIYDYQHNFLLPQCLEAFSTLKDSVRFFYTSLDSGIQQDKGAFYAFLGSLIFGESYSNLQSNADPTALATTHPTSTEAELRQIASQAINNALDTITEEQRSAMYNNARSLHCLKELSFFLYDRIILSFTFEPSVNGQICPGPIVREQLVTLNNILFSLRNPPSMELLESLFVFVLQTIERDEQSDMNVEMTNLLTRAETSLRAISEFNKTVPLTLILRCISHNMSLSPVEITGGEDWFTVLKEYWRDHTDEQFVEYMRTRRQRDLVETFKQFLKGEALRKLENTGTDSDTEKIYISNTFALEFLLTFYPVVFLNDISKTLRPILIDGEFVRRENRTEFTESYNTFLKLEDSIKEFDNSLAPEGELGKRFALANADMSSLPGKRRKMQQVVDEANEISHKIVDSTRIALKGMINILNGILRRDANGQYDMLINMTKFLGKDASIVGADGAPRGGKASSFLNNIIDALQKFQNTSQILNEIDAIERNN